MAAYTGGIVSYGNRASRSKTNERRQVADRLVEVLEYNLDQAIMVAKTDDGRVLHVHIDPESIKRNEESIAKKRKEGRIANQISFMGHLINDQMETHIPAGKQHKAILERSEVVRSTKQGDETILVVRANRIINVTNPEKTHEGLFTVSAYNGRIAFVQEWPEDLLAIDVEDGDKIDQLVQEIDKSFENFGAMVEGKPVVMPSVGIQLRVIVPNDSAANANQEENQYANATPAKYLVIDTSACVDWIPGKKDEEGNVVVKGHPLDSDAFEAFVSGYIEYAEGRFPSLDFKIEVVPYKNFPAGKMSPYLVLKDSQADPVTQLATTHTRLSQDDDSKTVGKNWAVRGIIQLTSDAEVKISRTQLEIIPRNYVSRLHANNVKGHVHSWIKSSDGEKCAPHPMLKRFIPVDALQNSSARVQNTNPQAEEMEQDDDSGSSGNGSGGNGGGAGRFGRGSAGNSNAGAQSSGSSRSSKMVEITDDDDFNPFASEPPNDSKRVR
jgi:hypothetical protein